MQAFIEKHLQGERVAVVEHKPDPAGRSIKDDSLSSLPAGGLDGQRVSRNDPDHVVMRRDSELHSRRKICVIDIGMPLGHLTPVDTKPINPWRTMSCRLAWFASLSFQGLPASMASPTGVVRANRSWARCCAKLSRAVIRLSLIM
jgi:hypothetical protein